MPRGGVALPFAAILLFLVGTDEESNVMLVYLRSSPSSVAIFSASQTDSCALLQLIKSENSC